MRLAELLRECVTYEGTGKNASDFGFVSKWDPSIDIPYLVVEIPDEYFVVDVDLPDLIVPWLTVPTAKVSTPHGAHYWFKTPFGFKVPTIIGLLCDEPMFSKASPSADKFWRNIDILTVGDHATVPPSPGYEGGLEDEISYAPYELISFIYRKCYSVATGEEPKHWRAQAGIKHW